MARIPTADDSAARPAPRPSTRAQGYQAGIDLAAQRAANQQQQRDDAALIAVGNQTVQTGLAIMDAQRAYHDRKGRNEYDKATAEFLKRKSILDNEIPKQLRDQYDQWEKTYQEKLTEAQGEVAGSISIDNWRGRFESESQIDIIKGTDTMGAKAQAREADKGRADLDETLTGYLNEVGRAEDDATRQRIIDAAGTAIDNARSNGYLNDVQAQQAQKKFAESYARARLLSLPENEQIAILRKQEEDGGTWAQFIPPVERAKLLAAATNVTKEDARRIAAQNHVNRLMAEHPGDYEAQIAAARKIEDPIVMGRTLSYLDREHTRMENVKRDQQDAQAQQFFDAIEAGADIDDLPARILANLPEGQQKSLRLYAEYRHGRRPKNPGDAWTFYDNVMLMYGERPGSILDIPFATLMEKAPEERRDALIKMRQDAAKARREGRQPVVESDQGQVNAIIKGTLDTLGIKTKPGTEGAKRAAGLRFRLEQEIEAHMRANKGARPSVTQVQEMANRLAVKYHFDKGFLDVWGTDVYEFELTGTEDWSTVEVPDEEREQILDAYYNRHGKDAPPLTDDEIRLRYLKLHGK